MKGVSLVFTEQRALTRKFFESSVAKVRAIYKMANRDADNWLKTIMSPMESQVREHQVQLRRRLESIKRIHQASDTLEERVQELEQIRDGIREQEKEPGKPRPGGDAGHRFRQIRRRARCGSRIRLIPPIPR
jgi:hypothetical protein